MLPGLAIFLLWMSVYNVQVKVEWGIFSRESTFPRWGGSLLTISMVLPGHYS
jgi:hypothetical protein